MFFSLFVSFCEYIYFFLQSAKLPPLSRQTHPKIPNVSPASHAFHSIKHRIPRIPKAYMKLKSLTTKISDLQQSAQYISLRRLITWKWYAECCAAQVHMANFPPLFHSTLAWSMVCLCEWLFVARTPRERGKALLWMKHAREVHIVVLVSAVKWKKEHLKVVLIFPHLPWTVVWFRFSFSEREREKDLPINIILPFYFVRVFIVSRNLVIVGSFAAFFDSVSSLPPITPC